MPRADPPIDARRSRSGWTLPAAARIVLRADHTLRRSSCECNVGRVVLAAAPSAVGGRGRLVMKPTSVARSPAAKAGHGPRGPCVHPDQAAPQPLDPAAPVPLRNPREGPARRAAARHLLLSPLAALCDLTRRLPRQQRADASNRRDEWSRGVAAWLRSQIDADPSHPGTCRDASITKLQRAFSQARTFKRLTVEAASTAGPEQAHKACLGAFDFGRNARLTMIK